MLADTVKENSLAYASYVWRVTIGTELAQEDVLVLTEDAVPGVDFSAILRIHTRDFARNRMVPLLSVKMKSATLLGRAFGATKMTDSLRDPELELSEDGSVQLSDDLITRVKNFTQRLENSTPDGAPPSPAPEAEEQYSKWQNMAFHNVSDRTTYTRREITKDCGIAKAGDVIIEKPHAPAIKLDGTDDLDGKVVMNGDSSKTYGKVDLSEVSGKSETPSEGEQS